MHPKPSLLPQTLGGGVGGGAAIKKVSLITTSDTVSITAPDLTPKFWFTQRTRERGRVSLTPGEEQKYLQEQYTPSVEIEELKETWKG